ncbi:MAG: substrate-binding domain-containing protein [Hamadaea sp.]|uniref:substrate-binding domain-containing protein n=1 Tax=Hamadaea sp. TaxID=2024425 RepID=UPI0017C0EAF5|nr:substrate-binding domain-containing protein [Hamadaea sp.]NUR69489.1 substrate-binding domain-containing protein [Hamadaea sp.]NUT20725.1 substrate-binding domain-containing protein [Hamadaea sp.]
MRDDWAVGGPGTSGLPDPPARPPAELWDVTSATIGVALVVPLRGPAGIFGPSCELCAELAVEQVNRAGGVLGRELRLVTVDGGAPPNRVAAEVEALVSVGAVHGVTGWHISSVRQSLAPRIAHRVPYVYTALYEGGEHTDGVFLTSETPDIQLAPAMSTLTGELGLRRWFIVGNDYVWPRRTAVAARGYAARGEARICGEAYVPLGTHDFTSVLRRVEESDADAVLMLLVGNDAVRFNRAFARSGLDGRCVRLSTLMDENMLLGSGVTATSGLYSAAGFFASLVTAENLDFHGLYARRFGVDAPPLGSLGESCYEGVLLLSALIEQARSLDVQAIGASAGAVSYEGPRGLLRLRRRHVGQRIYLAEARGLEFDVVAQL